MANSLYDVYLGDIASLQGYRCSQFVRDSAPLIAAKFATGAPGQTDLDLLKSASVDSLENGIFQRTHIDTKSVARGLGFYNAFDENFYPTIPTESPSATMIAGSVAAKVESEAYSFVNFYQRSGGASYNGINKIVGKTVTSLISGTPAAIYGTASTVKTSSMALHKGYLYLANAPLGYTNTNCQRYNIAAGTWQDIGGYLAIFFEMRGLLYGITNDAQIYSCTNETIAGAATYTLINSVGGSDITPLDAKEFNGAAWITKSDGIYRFDGVNVVKVLNLNAANLTVWNGALWFTSNNWLYRFDGATVQKIQYFTETIYQLSSNSQYLFVLTWTTTNTNIDSPKVYSGSGFARIYAYNGLAFSQIMEKDITIEQAIDHALIYSSNYLTYSQPQFGFTAWDNNLAYCINLTNIFSSSAVTSNSLLDITTSEFDDGFPNILKSLELIEVNYSGMTNGDVITVKYQLYDGKTWGNWITAGTINYNSALPYIEITGSSNKLFKRLKINAYVSTMTSGSTLAIKGFSWRYTLQPRARWRWQLGLMANGNSTIKDRAGNDITTDANALANTVTKSLKQKTPLFMLSPDYGLVKAQITNTDLTFIIKGQVAIYTDPYNEYPLVGVKNHNGVWEILRVSTVSYNSGSNETTITVLERGYYGVTAAQIDASAEFHLAFRVYITRLLRDAPILTDEVYNEQPTTGESQLQRQFLIEVTEI